MTAADRLRWIARGSPFRLMTPAAALRDILRSHGYTVYDIGNKQHLEAEPPEDHTPYSETGYPGQAEYGVGYAIDIMPPAAGSGLPSLGQLGAQLRADRRADVPGISWLKYMNWEPGDGNCWQDSWRPYYRRRASTDRGHIHLSGLTGFENSTIGTGYDPVARIRGDEMFDQEQADRLWATTNRALSVLSGTDARYTVGGRERVEKNVLAANLRDMASAVTLLRSELATVQSALNTNYAALASAVQQLADRPDPGTVVISDEQLERVLRRIYGSVDGATPA